LQRAGVTTIGGLSTAEPSRLEEIFGKRSANYLLAAANGTDVDPVRSDLEPTQFSRIVTLKRDTRDPREIFEQLTGGLEAVHQKASASYKSFRTISVIGVLSDLSIRTKSKTFETPINEMPMIKETAFVLFEELAGSVGKDIRRAGIRVSGLASAEEQTSLSDFLRTSG